MNFHLYESFAMKVAREAGQILRDNFQKKFAINYKGTGKNNLVTAIDRLSENFIIKSIQARFPDHHILTEESGEVDIKTTTKRRFRWIIDPIDGTNNYAHAHPFFAVSIGLEMNGEMVVGVVYAPMYDELFHGTKGGGAFLNGKSIHVSKVKKIEEAILATGFSYRNKEKNFPYFEHFALEAQGTRRCGAAALELAYLAAGRQDGFWEFGLKSWDFAAGKVLIEAAGGKITNIEGKTLQLSDHNLIGSNKDLYPEILKNIQLVKKRSNKTS